MGAFIKGQVVVVPFPFTDLSGSKKRPAVVVANLSGDDVILCQITSKHNSDGYSVSLEDADFSTGSLKQQSNIRPNRLFTADSKLIAYSTGHLKPAKITEVINLLVRVLTI